MVVPEIELRVAKLVDEKKSLAESAFKKWNKTIYEPVKTQLTDYLASEQGDKLRKARLRRYDDYVHEIDRSRFILSFLSHPNSSYLTFSFLLFSDFPQYQ